MKRISVIFAGLVLLMAPSLPVLAGGGTPCHTDLLISYAVCTQPQWATEGCEIWMLREPGYGIDFFEITSDEKSVAVRITAGSGDGDSCTQTISPDLPGDWKIRSAYKQTETKLRINIGGAPIPPPELPPGLLPSGG